MIQTDVSESTRETVGTLCKKYRKRGGDLKCPAGQERKPTKCTPCNSQLFKRTVKRIPKSSIWTLTKEMDMEPPSHVQTRTGVWDEVNGPTSKVLYSSWIASQVLGAGQITIGGPLKRIHGSVMDE